MSRGINWFKGPGLGRQGIVLLLLAALVVGQWPSAGMAYMFSGSGSGTGAQMVHTLPDPSAYKPEGSCPSIQVENHRHCVNTLSPAVLPDIAADETGSEKGSHSDSGQLFLGGRNPLPDPHPPRNSVIGS